MQDSENPKLRKLDAAILSLEASLALLRAERDDVTAGATADDPLLGTKEIFAETGLGHDGVKAAAERGELAVSRGPRGKLLVARSELRRYLQSKPIKPRKAEPVAESLEAWDGQALRALKGGRQ